MGAQNNRISACSVIARNDISDIVSDGSDAQVRQDIHKCSGAFGLAERGRRNFRQPNLFGLDIRFVFRNETKCPLNSSILEDILDESLHYWISKVIGGDVISGRVTRLPTSLYFPAGTSLRSL